MKLGYRAAPQNETQLDDLLTSPTPRSINAASMLDGDLLILGAGGKMGPSLAVLAQRSIHSAGLEYRVHCVSRFSNSQKAQELQGKGIRVTSADLLEPGVLDRLPDVPNVIYLAGMKFGSTGAEPTTWMQNTFLPGLVAQRFKHSRIVALSTGNVYPFMPIDSGGATEETLPQPRGEYAQSCLGRERMFQYAAQVYGTLVTLIRLNYANDLHYGVLLDIAQRVLHGEPVDITMSSVNLIWQGDANRMFLQALMHCASPAAILNVTGQETVSVRWLVNQFGSIFQREPQIAGAENSEALLSNSTLSIRLFGPLETSLGEMIDWTAAWLLQGGSTLGKPTHFETRDGRF